MFITFCHKGVKHKDIVLPGSCRDETKNLKSINDVTYDKDPMPNGRYPVGTRLIPTCHDHANRYLPEKRNFTCTKDYGWFPAVPYYSWCVLSHGKYACHSLKFPFTIYDGVFPKSIPLNIANSFHEKEWNLFIIIILQHMHSALITQIVLKQIKRPNWPLNMQLKASNFSDT